MRKFYHFLPKPELPKLTPREQRIERLNFQRDIGFMKVYAIFLATFISLAYIVQWVAYDPLGDLHTEICAHSTNSPLCKDFNLLERVDTIASKKNVPTRLVVWIYNAESTLGTHFNKDVCASYNNWAGLKGRKFDDGRVEMFAANRRKPDKNGCWLYKFESVEQATQSLVNTIAIGYKGCNHKVTCIAYDFVGDPNVAEPSWINRVGKFYRS